MNDEKDIKDALDALKDIQAKDVTEWEQLKKTLGITMDFSTALSALKEGKTISNRSQYLLAKYTTLQGEDLDVEKVVLFRYDDDEVWEIDTEGLGWEEVLNDNWRIVE